MHDPARPQPRVVTPGATFSQSVPAPSDAVVLFDGKDFSKWEGQQGAVKWKIENDYMETTKTGPIRTKDEFGDFQLHLEFATPAMVEGKANAQWQQRHNIFGRYEVQCWTQQQSHLCDGQVGALYGQTPPLVPASRPPGEWQTYDIIFESARWDETGKSSQKGQRHRVAQWRGAAS
jgi:hypothetical protein